MSGKTGRAMVNFGVGFPWEPREYPIPEPEPGAIVAKITMASICGTDVHLYRGDFGGPSATRQKPSISDPGPGVCIPVQAPRSSRRARRSGRPAERIFCAADSWS